MAIDVLCLLQWSMAINPDRIGKCTEYIIPIHHHRGVQLAKLVLYIRHFKEKLGNITRITTSLFPWQFS